MAQIHEQTHFGAGLAREGNRSLERLIQNKVRAIEEKHEYDRNLHVLKGLNVPNAEELAHANPDQLTQLLKQQSKTGSTNPEFTQALSAYNQTGAQLPGMEQQEPQQQDEVAQLAQTPEAQQAILAHLDTPEGQAEFTPEQAQEIRQNIQKAQQMAQGSPKQQLLQGGQPQQQPEFNENDAYSRLIGSAKTPFELNKAKELRDLRRGGGVSEKEQLAIDKANKPFVDKMIQYVEDARKRGALASEALGLVEKGEVSEGAAGLLPERILTAFNEADSDFVKLTGELANQKALELRGPVGKAKIEAAQRTKANLSDPKASKEKVLKREIQESKKAEALEQAYTEILAENNDVQPRDFETKIRKRAKEIEKETKIEVASQAGNTSDVFEELPEASKYKGRTIRNPETGELLKSDGKKWVKE
jgi:hypothetical protein